MPTPPPDAPTPRLTLVLGGARSGKSDLAERLVLAHPGPVLYVATGRATDDDMATRIAAHRGRRHARFTTIDAGDDLSGKLRAAPERPAVIDSLGTWLASPAIMACWSGPELDIDLTAGGGIDAALKREVSHLVVALASRQAPTVVVSDEAGLGVHPETAVGRRWRDALGAVNQRVAAVADEVLLVVAGRVLRLSHPEDIGLTLAPWDDPDAQPEPDDDIDDLDDLDDLERDHDRDGGHGLVLDGGHEGGGDELVLGPDGETGRREGDR